ncbi:MAG: hypothetical protein KDK23_13655 [Leptospiraceae bacterium]|nr:hypothetical protein [Leptospiraceae bacterium]
MDGRDVITATYTHGIPSAGLRIYAGPLGIGLYWAGNGHAHGPIFSRETGLKGGETGEHSFEEFTLLLTMEESSKLLSVYQRERIHRRGKELKKLFPSDNPAHYTRIGFNAGLCIGLRFEVNPGELLDLVLGVFTIDIYSDDVYGKSFPEVEKKSTPSEARKESPDEQPPAR